MPTLAERNNNPGNLTVNRPGQILYEGQTGTRSANGLTYAVFGTPQAGTNALLDYIRRHTSNGRTTIGDFISHYLGNPNLAPNAANPHPGSYAAGVASAVGGNLGSVITSANITDVARGIERGEGSLAAFGSLLGQGSSGSISGGGSPSTSPDTGNTGSGGLLEAIANFFQISTQERIVAVVLGSILIVVAIGILLINTKFVQETVIPTATKAAALAA